jgi:hypothetical protein
MAVVDNTALLRKKKRWRNEHEVVLIRQDRTGSPYDEKMPMDVYNGNRSRLRI